MLRNDLNNDNDLVCVSLLHRHRHSGGVTSTSPRIGTAVDQYRMQHFRDKTSN